MYKYNLRFGATYHGAVHVEDARVPVLLQTEGRYEILGSVFSITI
jgi:hypothetical protein